jgi:hypothetical protein
MLPRGRLLLAATLLPACGAVAPFAIGASSSPSAQTVTVTVPGNGASSVTTLTVPADPQSSARLDAALDDPRNVPLAPGSVRPALTAELRRLDAFLAQRPTLQPYREHLWYVAHRSRAHVDARRLAALLWCTVWFPRACN